MKQVFSFCFLILATSCANIDNSKELEMDKDILKSNILLDRTEAERLLDLPLKCIGNPFPYKAGHTISKAEDLDLPQIHHPAFYGCFDWHSSVHGHWSVVYLLKNFKGLPREEEARTLLNKNLTVENIQKEIEYFSMNKYTQNFERTYGWAWLLKLAEELYTWNDTDAQKWYKALKPLCDLINDKYIEYLPKLVYAIRVGEHSNTAFGLTFAWDYAKATNNTALQSMIEKRARDFYMEDENCPLSWEPSGYDFLSPCLEEMDIMRRVLNEDEFENWYKKFIRANINESNLVPAEVKDRSDGKLVHLDGLNFSRAWCLYGTAKNIKGSKKLVTIADQHLNHSIKKIKDGDYSGEHWLGSFALFAYKSRSELFND